MPAILRTPATIPAQAYRLLDDADDWLRSDWRTDTPPSAAQLAAVRRAGTHIARARTALNRVAS